VWRRTRHRMGPVHCEPGEWNGVPPVAPERMTTTEASNRKPAASTRTVDLDRFKRIRAARRLVAARRRSTREKLLVPGDQPLKHLRSHEGDPN